MFLKKNPLVYLICATWHHSTRDRARVALFWLMFVAAEAVVMIGQPLAMAAVINAVQVGGITPENIWTLLGLLGFVMLLEIVFWIFHGPGRVMEEVNAFKVRVAYRRHMLSGIIGLPLDWHTEHHSGNTIDKVAKGAAGLYSFSRESFVIVYNIVRFILSYVLLTYFSPSAGIIVALIIVVTYFVTVYFDRVLIEQYRTINEAENGIAESIADALNNITSVIILRVERLVCAGIMHKVEEPLALVKTNTIRNEWKWFATSMCCALMSFLVLAAYFWQHYGTPAGIALGSLYVLVQSLATMSGVFQQFTTMYGGIVRRRAEVTNAEVLSQDFRDENLENHVLPKGWRTLSVKDLSFAYGSGSDRPHIDDVSLAIERGERIAFVGATGSGKTTLLKVMRDLHQPQSGTLSVDGKVIPEGFAGIRQVIALIPQDPEIFATTILANITIGAEYPEEFLRRFMDMACFTDVVNGLPNGLASSIKEKGVNLSGGQKQRLALARGLLACHGKDIILLDEPTSSLDAVTEMQVYRNIFGGFPEATIISSIHRLHLLPLFDRICMFEDGKIIATGTLDELLAQCLQFRTLWDAMKDVGTPTN